MGRDFNSGVFGEVLKEEKAKEDQAKRDQQKAGGGSGGAAARRGPPKAADDAFDQLSGGKRDPDVAGTGRPGRVKLGS